MDKITIDIEQKKSNNNVLEAYAVKFAEMKQQEKNGSAEEKGTQAKRMSCNSSVLWRYRICKYDIKSVNKIVYK